MKNNVLALLFALSFFVTTSAMESKDVEKVFLDAVDKLPQGAFQESCILPGKNDAAAVRQILDHQLPLISTHIEQLQRLSSTSETLKKWLERRENCKKRIEDLQEPNKELNAFELLFASNKVYDLIPTIYKSYLDFLNEYKTETDDLALIQQLEMHCKVLEKINQELSEAGLGDNCKNQ